MSEKESLYERLGGEGAVEAAVEIFYRNVLRDERISHFFEDVDIREQIEKQKRFLSMVFGGPEEYDGDGLRRAHDDMDLNDVHFDAVLVALEDALEELDVPDREIGEVLEIAESTRGDVLGR